jgi:hypothetical protein
MSVPYSWRCNMSSEYYECIKTGATIRVANRYAYGDLFRLGGGYFMHVAQWVEDWHRESWRLGQNPINAQFETWYQWFHEYEGDSKPGAPSIVILNEPDWFDFDGRKSD